MNLIDLFAGIGGFSYAAHQLGWQTIAFVEKDEFCQKVLRKNFGQNIEIYDDITTFSGKPFRGRCDIITGGFPCQPFSSAGKRKGTDDSRYLWNEMLRTIEEIQPRFVVGENVLGILNWSRGLVFDQVHIDLETQGYEVGAFVLPAAGIGADHQRDRVWFVAHSKSNGNNQWQKSFGRKESSERTFFNGKSFKPTAITREAYIEPQICRRNDGVSNRVDRLRALGNSIVPQIAFEIFKAIEQAENNFDFFCKKC